MITDCMYCAAPADGIDEDGNPTCGDVETCEPVAGPLPADGVAEVSGEDSE